MGRLVGSAERWGHRHEQDTDNRADHEKRGRGRDGGSTGHGITRTVPGATSGFQLRPSVTVDVPANSFVNWEFTITWDSIGQANGFSNRFIVVVDAGADYGQDEVWLYVSNWS